MEKTPVNTNPKTEQVVIPGMKVDRPAEVTREYKTIVPSTSALSGVKKEG